jgi:hypothetical protein
MLNGLFSIFAAEAFIARGGSEKCGGTTVFPQG